jgi:hypothetical protein
MLGVLDKISSRPGELLTGKDFVHLGYSVNQTSGAAGAIVTATYTRFGRSNPPLEFVNIAGRWHYRMNPEMAVRWRVVRGLVDES